MALAATGSVGQVYYRVLDNNSGAYISTKGMDEDFIFKNIVSQIKDASYFTKIGILAPPGTKVTFNDAIPVMIGKTGIYELDDDINITSMIFTRPPKFQKDEEQSLRYKELGIAEMLAADEKRSAAMAELNKNPIPDEFLENGEENPAHKNYWDTYSNIQSEYIAEYTAALNKYNTGVNGVYIEAPGLFEELNNVIIDYIYE